MAWNLRRHRGGLKRGVEGCFGLLVAKLPWIDLVYVYAIAWMLIGDQAKLLAYRFAGAARGR